MVCPEKLYFDWVKKLKLIELWVKTSKVLSEFNSKSNYIFALFGAQINKSCQNFPTVFK